MIRNVAYYTTNYNVSEMYKDINPKIEFTTYNRCHILGKIALFYIEFYTYSVVNDWENLTKLNMNYTFSESLFNIKGDYNGIISSNYISLINNSLPANVYFSANFVAYIN